MHKVCTCCRRFDDNVVGGVNDVGVVARAAHKRVHAPTAVQQIVRGVIADASGRFRRVIAVRKSAQVRVTPLRLRFNAKPKGISGDGVVDAVPQHQVPAG